MKLREEKNQKAMDGGLHRTLATEPYEFAKEQWPKEGRHIFGQYDDETIVVYQAYNTTIGMQRATLEACWVKYFQWLLVVVMSIRVFLVFLGVRLTRYTREVRSRA